MDLLTAVALVAVAAAVVVAVRHDRADRRARVEQGPRAVLLQVVVSDITAVTRGARLLLHGTVERTEATDDGVTVTVAPGTYSLPIGADKQQTVAAWAADGAAVRVLVDGNGRPVHASRV